MGNKVSAARTPVSTDPLVVDAAGSRTAVITGNTLLGRYRWVICGLLFFATTVNYIDRQVLGILSKDLQQTVAWSALNYGWRWAFVLTGAIGFLWLLFWIPMYARPEVHRRVSKAELDYIQSDPPDPPAAKIPWIQLIPHRQTSAFAIGKYMTDPIWWFYLYWIPNFLRDNHKLDLTTIGLPLVAIYLIADVGSVGGGWLSSRLIKRGWTINRGRKTAMLICALAVTPIIFASNVKSLWVAVGLVGLAAAAHQGWSANLFTTASDMFPRRAVGSVVGIGGMSGAIGGATMAVATGYILQSTGGNYRIVFVIAGTTYLLALLTIHLLAPNLEPVENIESASRGISIGSIVGFGFVGLVFGSFSGWLTGLISRLGGPNLFKYMMLGAFFGAIIGVIGGLVINNSTSSVKTR